jgi:hypothetical protein
MIFDVMVIYNIIVLLTVHLQVDVQSTNFFQFKAILQSNTEVLRIP